MGLVALSGSVPPAPWASAGIPLDDLVLEVGTASKAWGRRLRVRSNLITEQQSEQLEGRRPLFGTASRFRDFQGHNSGVCGRGGWKLRSARGGGSGARSRGLGVCHTGTSLSFDYSPPGLAWGVGAYCGTSMVDTHTRRRVLMEGRAAEQCPMPAFLADMACLMAIELSASSTTSPLFFIIIILLRNVQKKKEKKNLCHVHILEKRENFFFFFF